MMIIITVYQLRTYLRIVIIEIRVIIIEIALIGPLNNQRETIRMIKDPPFQLRIKHPLTLGMTSKTLHITKGATKATNSLLEETKNKIELSSISARLQNLWTIDPTRYMSKSIRVLEIKEGIIDSIRCLREDQGNINRKGGLMGEGPKINRKSSLKRQGKSQIIIGNHRKKEK